MKRAFYIKNTRTLVLLFIVVLIAQFSAPDLVFAFRSTGKLGKDLEYRDLRFRRSLPYNYLVGTIVNLSKSEKERIYITFSAYNVFGNQIWQTELYIDKLAPGARKSFSKKLGPNSEYPNKLVIRGK